MKRIYHKGRFRCGEWGKHLRPYCKKVGNRRYRRTAKADIESHVSDSVLSVKPENRRKRVVIVKYTHVSPRGVKVTRVRKFVKVRDAHNALSKPGVYNVTFIAQ